VEELESAFRALADPHRRHLLDQLRARDGQALGELEAALPSMTRFGVMKHLRVLADAGLVTSRRAGRRKLHFLNPVPIQLIADRWISRYAEPWISGMANLKHSLEASPMSPPKHVYEIYIAATPEKIWQAITDSTFTKRYYYGNTVESDWHVGSSLLYRNPDGSIAIESEIVEAEPPKRLVQTFSFPGTGDRPSRVTWEIEPRGASSLLTLVHDDFDAETETFKGVAHGWIPVLSGLKTLLETGESLAIEDPEHAEATV
jgi:uncharacterized protein YndB with AHSA1/START domain/DNA-binding transcriptional ArsR family regulator